MPKAITVEVLRNLRIKAGRADFRLNEAIYDQSINWSEASFDAGLAWRKFRAACATYRENGLESGVLPKDADRDIELITQRRWAEVSEPAGNQR